MFLLIAVNFYYNSITLDMQRIEDYVMETNLILEDEFGIEIPDEEAENFKCIGDICKYIEENK
ncbi:hypothetical protein [Clostridioides difficile]|uniref:hypothetical protein n=1 Tax=Clostridioides difficile TaxID=1496 RepID=UPI001F472AA5|nr:hypothetical protein [Clostridioides difficile]